MVANLTQNFNAALAYTQMMRDKYLSHFYKTHSYDGRYVYINKSVCSSVLQKELAVDTVMQANQNGSLCIEEKIEQTYTGNFALETESCTVVGREHDGWMRYAKADYLLYAFAYENNCGLQFYLIDFPKLRDWFWNLSERYPSHTMPNTINHTRFEIVPVKDVVRAVPTAHYICTSEGCKFIPKRGSA